MGVHIQLTLYMQAVLRGPTMIAGILCSRRGSRRQLILLHLCRGLRICACALLTRCCCRQRSRGHTYDLQAM